MRRALILCLICASSLSAQKLSPEPSPVEIEQRITDETEKLFVYGDQTRLRSSIMRVVTDTRESLYKLIDVKEKSQQFPLEVRFYGKPGDDAPDQLYKKSFVLNPAGLALKLDLHLAKGVNENTLRQQLTELFLYEIGMREARLPNDRLPEFRLSPWLSQGVLEAILWEKNLVDRQLYARLFSQQSVYPIDDLLQEEDIQDQTEIIKHAFRVSSGVLVMALMNQPQGKEGILSLIQEAVTYEGEQKLLITKYFPDTTLSKNSLDKWWSLQLLSMSKRPAESLYTISETAEELEKLLTIEINNVKGETILFPPLNYLDLKQQPKLATINEVTSTYNDLSLLLTKAFPSYRPIIGGYQQVLLSTFEMPKKKRLWDFFSKKEEDSLETIEMLQRLEEERLILSGLGERVTDYLNWYQLERADDQQGAFDSYLRLKREINNASPSDGGHISSYLDDIQTLYQD